ncbi:uncharacterized protein LOC129398107 [Pan paniscus]|uniref:uncharacterized protein LOC129398107 n=1 Tax=Pan paniscus TaxID=9597 RepID=UPI0030051871
MLILRFTHLRNCLNKKCSLYYNPGCRHGARATLSLPPTPRIPTPAAFAPQSWQTSPSQSWSTWTQGVLPASVLARASARRGAARQNLGARRAGQPEAPLVAGAALRRVWAPGLEEEARGRERGRGGGGGAGAGAWNLQGLDPDTDQIFWNSLSNKRLLQGQNTLPARDPSYSAENGLMAEDGGDGRMKLRGNSNNLGDREWGLGLARGNALDCHSEEDEPGQHQREYLPDGNHINYWQTGAIKSERKCDNYAGKTGVNQEVHSHPVNNSWAFKYNTAIKRQF